MMKVPVAFYLIRNGETPLALETIYILLHFCSHEEDPRPSAQHTLTETRSGQTIISYDNESDNIKGIIFRTY
jgi:hypothetical protein